MGIVFLKMWSSMIFDPLHLIVLADRWPKMVLKRMVEWEKCGDICQPVVYETLEMKCQSQHIVEVLKS